MQLVRLAWLDNETYLHCPACGQEAVYDEPCAHLLFIYSASEGEFSYVADDIYDQVIEIAKKVRAEEADGEDQEPEAEEEFSLHYGCHGLEGELIGLPDTESRVVFMIAKGGFACGPAGDLSYVAFDLEGAGCE